MNQQISSIIGWDIGSRTLEAVCLNDGAITAIQEPFTNWQKKDTLIAQLKAMSLALGTRSKIGITITATLSDAFRSKREGLTFILDAVQAAMPEDNISVFGIDGQFHPLRAVYDHPLLITTANWLATAMAVARYQPDGLLVDVGETTTDIIPFTDAQVVTRGFNDSERLIRGELIYTGVLNTPVCAMVKRVPLKGQWCPIAGDVFATAQDVHLLLGNLTPQQCTAPSPDGRPLTRDFSAERLARMVCADAEILSRAAILTMAQHIEQAQINQITEAISQVMGRIQLRGPVIAVGKGAFLVQAAAHNLNLPCRTLTDLFTHYPVELPSATAIAYLLQ
ncbi:MAG: hydantoinase/oxoprolinase family protein, partial [Chloroflexota bacterium]